MSTHPKIYVAGHRGMVGSAIVRHLLAQGHSADRIVTRTHTELDLTDQAAVNAFFMREKPDYEGQSGQLHTIAKGCVNDVGLHHQVLVDEFGWVCVVGMNTAYLGSGQFCASRIPSIMKHKSQSHRGCRV